MDFQTLVGPHLENCSAVTHPVYEKEGTKMATGLRKVESSAYGPTSIWGSNPVLPEWSRTNVLSFARINVIPVNLCTSVQEFKHKYKILLLKK